MLFFGHIAIAVAAADAAGVDAGAAVAGNLLPDLTDKTGCWVLRVMPNGRWLGHGLPFVAASCALARLTLAPPRWKGFVLGYAAHLAADHWGGGRLPWAAPFGPRPVGEDGPPDLRWLLANLGPEVAGVLYLSRRFRRRLAAGASAP